MAVRQRGVLTFFLSKDLKGELKAVTRTTTTTVATIVTEDLKGELKDFVKFAQTLAGGLGNLGGSQRRIEGIFILLQ